jgi:cation diffusion facilitator CzcD-associated flavoprotein CzcO
MSGISSSTSTGENPHGTDSGTDSGGVNVKFLREKYRAERKRRLLPSANDQYPELQGALGDFLTDPYVDPDFSRPSVNDEVDALVVGGGFGGLLAASRLRKAGVRRIRVIEKGGDFGGVWYWNRYPGAMCDIESYIYMPLLEELGYIPSEKYAHQPEIFKYCQLVGKKFDLYKDALFQTELTELRWDDANHQWSAQTDRGDQVSAKYVVMAFGTQHRPRLPAIPGIEEFKGHTFHTSRWDYEYTGGDENGGLTGLADKRVGLVGTGATALQCVPALGESAAQLTIFQRTPSTVAVRGNRPTEPSFVETLRPGWQRYRMANFMSWALGKKMSEDLVDDGWTYAMKKVGTGPIGGSAEGTSTPSADDFERLDMELMEEIRARVDSIVEDKETAEALKPYYRFWCKRPGFHDEYLQTFNRPNVTLVDTHGRGVDSITSNGAIVDGTEYGLDCLIFATGFDVGHGYLSSGAFDVIGRGGLRLSEYWENGTRSFQGFFAVGFPNCFFMGSTQAGFSANFVCTLWEQAEHIAYVVQAVEDASGSTVETTTEAEEEWQVVIFENPNPEVAKFWEACTPSYFNSEGKTRNPKGLLVGRYPRGAQEYFAVLHGWREDGSLRGLVVK